jgi:hypothetical protein
LHILSDRPRWLSSKERAILFPEADMRRRIIAVTPAEVAAAKLRLVTDAKLGKKTPPVIRKIADARPEPPSD